MVGLNTPYSTVQTLLLQRPRQKKKKKYEDIFTRKIHELQTEVAVVVLSHFPNHDKRKEAVLPTDPKQLLAGLLPPKITFDELLECNLYTKLSQEPAVDFLVSSIINMLRKLATTKASDRNVREAQAAVILSQIQAQKGEINARNLVCQLYRHFGVLIPYKYTQNGQPLKRNDDFIGTSVPSKPEITYPPTKPNRRRPKSPGMPKHGRSLITTVLPILKKKADI